MIHGRDVAASAARCVVTAPATPLWSDPAAVRELGGPAGGSYRQFQSWAARQLADQARLKGRIGTVGLQGEFVRVIEDAGHGVLQVELPDQPDGPEGYIGFVAAGTIGIDARDRETHRIGASATLGVHRDGHFVVLASGAGVERRGMKGRHGQSILRLADGTEVEAEDEMLVAVNEAFDQRRLLRTAGRFLGVPYLWGGTDRSGIDCSGLVHVAARICGRRVPRDAHRQWETAESVPGWEQLQPGDLIFFGTSADPAGIDHVGICAVASSGWCK